MLHHKFARLIVILIIIVTLGLFLAFIVDAEKVEPSKSHSHHGESQSGQDSRLNQLTSSPALLDFNNWLKRLATTNYSLNDHDLNQGRALARSRREIFKELMSLSPIDALKFSVPRATYLKLPASIRQDLEVPISAYGDLRVYVVMLHEDHHSPHTMTNSRIEREVTIGTARYKALVYGRREQMTTKFDIPLQGIVLDGVMVVDEAPLSVIDNSEYETFGVDRSRVVERGVVAEVGGKLTYFSSPSELEAFTRDLIAWEAVIGPVRPKQGQTVAPWTLGVKTLLVIRLDFPDRPGEPLDFQGQPLTVSRALNFINNEISPFYVSNSFNKTSLQPTVTSVVRMPQSQSFYFNNVGALFQDAETAARNAGFDPDNFNLDLFAMGYNEGFPYGGVASVGARGAAVNGFYDLRVTAHELGHNYGLLHANLWRTTNFSTIGPGSNVEYGNPYDVMGNGFDSRAHFGANYKRRLDWLTDVNLQEVTQDGVYRVFAHDSPTTGGIRVLRVRKNKDKNYWIEFRQLFTDFPAAMGGAIVGWDYRSAGFRENQILDMAPQTESAFDAPLLVGNVFNDDENRIRISVLRKGNTTPESLDIKVEFNVGCTFGVDQTTQNFSASGGQGSIALTTPSGCKPIATTNTSWLTPIQEDTAPVRYLVEANYSSSPRTGTIVIAGQTVTVQQSATSTACAPQPANLVGWWRGEGNALDQTGTNHGTLVGGTNFTGGKIGGAILGDFSHSGGYVEVPDSASLRLTRSMTIEGWLKLDAPNGTIVRRGTDQFPPVRSYEIFMFNSQLFFAIWFGNSGAGVVSEPVPLGQFFHFAATLNDANNRMSIYINGNLSRQVTMTERANESIGSPLIIGDIDGATDELSIYNRALTPSEILTIYNAGQASTGATGKCLSSGSSNGTIQFAGTNYSVNEATPSVDVTVTRSVTTNAASVDYATQDTLAPSSCAALSGNASSRCDYSTTTGTLFFAAGEGSKTISIPIINDSYAEGSESFTVSLSNAVGASLGPSTAATVMISDNEVVNGANPIDNASFFVRQHYLDFLNREPDSAGLAFWTNEILSCGANVACIEVKRINVSAAFFLSIESQETGYLVYRFYKTSFGNLPGAPVPVAFAEFLRDTQQIARGIVVGQDDWQARLEANKQAFAIAFVERASFQSAFPASLTAAQFVDQLNNNAGGVLSASERTNLIASLTVPANSSQRASVLRSVAENSTLKSREFNKAFVLEEYVGYLRRSPNQFPDTDYNGFNFWLTKLNNFQGNFVNAEMVKSFLISSEYRQRFGP